MLQLRIRTTRRGVGNLLLEDAFVDLYLLFLDSGPRGWGLWAGESVSNPVCHIHSSGSHTALCEDRPFPHYLAFSRYRTPANPVAPSPAQDTNKATVGWHALPTRPSHTCHSTISNR